MDDTQPSRASDSAATRKRRSSILKSQRPPRTPFSVAKTRKLKVAPVLELEFNVATPTDTAKSRRVSFSRRTGVAEFATNEATTTWKNFYEEHNKSLESSGNEAAARQVLHLGRVFDQQFEEVEADLVSTLNAGPNTNISTSLNNFEQQLASLECTDNKITAPNNKFELSSFTNNHTKCFDDLAMPDITNQIDINFSTMQRDIGDNDDLDEIQKDLKQNFGCAQFGQNTSEYIEVDFNMTQVRNEDDMSITETVLSPKVQDVSKNSKSMERVDKENIAINPYAAPRETDNFAINEEPDSVLVFDGKRLTVHSEKKKEDYRQSTVNSVPQRKTIVLNVNDDLPNFIGDPHTSNTSGFIGIADLKKSMILEDLSITDDVNKRTVLYDDNFGDISVTEAVPNVLVADKRLIAGGNGNISITNSNNMTLEKRRPNSFDDQVNNISVKSELNVQEKEKRKTIVFDDNDISITQVLPINILPDKNKRRTIVYEDNAGNLSITQAIPNIQVREVTVEKRRTIVYEDETGNISVTQTIPSNILMAENSNDRRRTIVFESDSGNLSVTQALPSTLILQEQLMNIKETKIPAAQIEDSSRRRTIVYEDDIGNLSITQAVPNQVIEEISTQNICNNETSNFTKTNNRRTVVFDNDEADISLTQAVPTNHVINSIYDQAKIGSEDIDATNKRRTVTFDSDNVDISIMQAVSGNNIIKAVNNKNEFKIDNENVIAANKRRTVVFENDNADLSMTQAVSGNHIINAVNKENELKIANDYVDAGNKRRTIVFENDNADISMTQAVSSNQIINAIEKENELAKESNKRRTVVFENNEMDISMTQGVPVNQIINAVANINEFKIGNSTNKRQTIVFDNDGSDISMTQAVPANVIQNMYETNRISHNEPNLNEANQKSNDQSSLKSTNKRRTVIFEDKADISKIQENIRPQIFENIHDDLDDALNIALHTREIKKIHGSFVNDEDIAPKVEEKCSIVIGTDDNNISPPQPLPIYTSVGINIKSQAKSNEKLDLTMTDRNEENKFYIAEKASTSTIKEVNQEYVIQKSFDVGKQLAHFVNKPIPPTIVIGDEKDKDIDTIGVIDGKYSEIVVYQAALSNHTEHGDSQSQEASMILDNEKKSVSILNIKKSLSELDIEKQDEIPYSSSEVLDTKVEVVKIPSIGKQVCFAPSNEIQRSKSILNDLLDMSQASMEDIDDKNIMVKVEPAKENEKVTDGDMCSATSNDTMFVITDDRDEAEIETETQTNMPQIEEHTALPIDYKEESIAIELQDTIDDLKAKLAGNQYNSQQNNTEQLNRQYEKVVRSDLTTKDLKQKKSFKTANDTNELLQMLNDLTDKTIVQELEPHLEEEEHSEPLLIKGHLALENKNYDEPKRLSVASSRLSTALSREDLLNNISMARAALQSRIDIDSDLDDTRDSPEENIHKTYTRMSSEVVKSLNFDESMSEDGTETRITPLKKTVFGESSYMQDYKHNVIPDFMKDVSDGIKELMDDLVKPNNDIVPLDSQAAKKIPSTCSTHIQANLTTSSQVDILGLHSNPGSYNDVKMGKFDSTDLISEAVNRSMSRALKSPIKYATTSKDSEKSVYIETSESETKIIVPTIKSPDRVLVFDHNNPLNNVLLIPDAYTEPHKYDPVTSHESCDSDRSNAAQISLNENESDRVSTQYNVGNMRHTVRQSGDAIPKLNESKSTLSGLSRRMSVDQSTFARTDVKDTEVNTLIAMKGNKELLDASSSLTLVDDAFDRSKFDLHADSTSQEMMSPLKVIYTVKGIKEQIESDIQSTSNDEDEMQTKKRTYSAVKRDKHKQCTASSLDISPKPITKMQKLNCPSGLDFTVSEKLDIENRKNRKARKNKKPGTNITVQQLMTEFEVQPMDEETLDVEFNSVLEQYSSKATLETPSQSESDCKSPDLVSSFTSSNNLDRVSTESSRGSKPSRMDLVHEISSKKSVTETNSRYNVVAKLDMLPFMGSPECEWETSSGDTWSFRMLYARLRLSVRLEHRYDNATRTCVRADTCVRAVTLETIPADTKNIMAVLCVKFAAETMRHFIAEGCTNAGAVPRLVRRCAAAARLASRWARAMTEARARLAYSLDGKGLLTLKVANIPLRTVWEVSTQLSLVAEEGGAPWVCAGEMRARRVLGARDVPAPDLTRAMLSLTRDWGHAPTAIWRVFKYLKQRTREDDDLFTGL